MTRYASNTEVSSERSKAEIETTLERYGAEKFFRGWDDRGAVVGFIHSGRAVRFHLPLPDKDAAEFVRTPGGRKNRSPEDQRKAWDQACKQRWRALALVIKAKLEAVESGITTFEEEFLAHFVLPDGQSLGKYVIARLPEACSKNDNHLLLPAPDNKKP